VTAESTVEQEEQARWSGWMAAAHRGDARAYEALLAELGEAIDRYVRYRFAALGPLREDCVQECLLAIHVGRHTYDPRRPFRPWLYAIVRNRAIDFIRRSCRAPRLVVPAAASIEAQAADPAEELAAGELLAGLEPSHREAIELTKLQGYSTAQAAATAGISATAMRTRVSRALRATWDSLNKEQRT
jgi:RNA polymerase sigma-70 factor (ECF subfamily)